MQDTTTITPPLEPAVLESAQTMPITQSDTKQKRGLSLKLIGCIVLLGVLLLACIISIVIAIPYLKNNFVPVLSPLTENLTSSPSEQVASRMSPYITMGAKAVELYGTDQTDILTKLDYKGIPVSSNTMGVEYEINMSMTNNSSTDNVSGEATNDSIISSFTNGKNMSFKISGEGKSNYKSSTDMQSEQTMTLSATSDGITAEASMELKTINDSLYLKVNSIPSLGIDNLDNYIDKWYSLSQKDLSDTLESVEPSTSNMKTEDINKIKDFILNSKELFTKPTLQKNIKSAGEETYHGITVKCYSLTLDKNGMLGLANDIDSLIKNDEDKLKLTETDVTGLDEIYTKLCFDKNSVFMNKIEINIKGDNPSVSVSYGLIYGSYDLGKKVDITQPADASDIKDALTELFGGSIQEITNEDNTDDQDYTEIPEIDYDPEMGY